MDKPNKNNKNCQERLINTNFEEIFYQSPIGTFFYDKEGRLTNANDSALNIARIPKLDDVLGTNIFDNPILDSKKEELHEKELIKFQDSLDLIQIKEHNIYNPIEPKVINIDWTVSVIDSGYLVQIQDLTEIKRSESAIKLKEAQFEVLTRNIHLGVALIDETGRFVVVNPAFMEIFNLDNKLDILNVNNQDWSQWNVYGEDNKLLDVDQHPVRKVAITGKPIMDQSVKLKNPGDNKFKWLLVSAVPILNKDSSINMIICTYYDVTSHKEDEEALKESEEKYINLFERMNEGFTIAEMIYDNDDKPFDFRWIEMNHAYEEIIGFTRDTLLKTTARTVFPELQPKLVENFEKVMLTGKQLQFESYNIELNKWFDVIAYKITQKHFAYLTLDITKRKQTENERNKLILEVISKEEELSALIENIVDEVWFCDVEGNIILANAAARRFEKERELENVNSIDKMISQAEIFNADGSARSKEDSPLIRALNGEIVDLEDIVVFRRTGKKIYRQITAAPIKDNKNKITGAVAVIRDITESKKIQEKLVLQSKALKKSENSLANAQHIAHIGSWEWNIKTGNIIWSNELYSIYGLNPNTFIPTLSSFGDYMHPDDEEYVNQHVD